jgi:hypothetical protein
MRHFFRVFFVLGMLIPSTMWAQQGKNDLERDGLKGNVQRVRTIFLPDYFIDSNNVRQINFGSYSGMRVQGYDAQGNKKYDSTREAHNPYLRVRDNFYYKVYEYANGQAVKVTSGDLGGTTTMAVNPAPTINTTTPDTQYTYNSRENKTEIIITSHKNKPVKTPYLSPEKLLNTQEPNDSGGKAIWRYYFDENGKDTLVTFRIIDKQDSIRVYWKNSYKYDEQKNVLEHSFSDWRSGKVKRYTYVYDNHGNWISRRLYVDDEIQETYMRYLEYQ